MIRPSHQLYDANAQKWVRHEPSSVSDFTGRPRTLELCEPVQGLRILDLGCGEGYCARKLAARGAEVVGIDNSAQMIAAARTEEAERPKGIRYEVGDATSIAMTNGSVDLVLAMFLFNYLDLEQSRTCMREVARVLRPSGKFVFAVPHPSLPFIREEAPPFYFSVDAGYFSARGKRYLGRIWKRDGTPLDVQVCHKTLEDYFALLRDAGFRTLPTVLELGVTEEIVAIDPAFFTPLVDTPLHLAFAVER